MPLRSDWSVRPCPIARSMDYLGDPWTVLVLRELMYGVRRFEELLANTEASDKTLASRLDRMVDIGLVRRERYAGTTRPRYEYHLTEAGEAAKPVLNALAVWGAEHTAEPGLRRRFQILCESCGGEVGTVDSCGHCGAELAGSGTRWVRPALAVVDD